MMQLICYVADMRFALPVHDVVEVVGRPTFESTPASPPWVAGMFVHRGVVTPVVDIAALTGLGHARSLWSSRVIVLNCNLGLQTRRLGLLFDRAHAEQIPDHRVSLAKSHAVQLLPWGKTLIDEHGTYCELDLTSLLSPERCATLFPTSS